MKACNTCNVEKKITEFHKDNYSNDGHANRCKECASKTMRDWWKKKNPDAVPRIRRPKNAIEAQRKSEEVRAVAMRLSDGRGLLMVQKPGDEEPVYTECVDYDEALRKARLADGSKVDRKALGRGILAQFFES